MGACDFCLSCSGFMGDKFFSLSLMLFGGWISDLCKNCFVGDFALLGVVHVGGVDPGKRSNIVVQTKKCLDYNIGSLSIPNLLQSWCLAKFH